MWSKLDALYVLAQQTQADARLNLVSASYPLTGTLRVGVSPLLLTFTPYVGFSGFSNTNQLDTGLNPGSVAGLNFVQNSANMGVWVYSVVSGAGLDIGSNVNDNNVLTAFSGSFYVRVNGTNSNDVPTPGTKGLFSGDRSSSASVVPYWNGVSQGTQTSPSAAIGNLYDFQIGNLLTNPVSHTLSEAHIGASLGSAGNLALYNRLRTYMTAVGVP